MKTKSSSVWMFTLMVALLISMAACGNSQKKKDKAAEQPMDTVTVIESETVVVMDSVAMDTTAVPNNVAAPKKTK